MIANALFATTVCFLAIGLFLMGECQFLIPYRQLLWEQYGTQIAIFAGLIFVNLFAAFYLICRKLFLKDTGEKLAHLEKQLRSGGTISEELSRRLRE
jgi:hypothetical protein